MALGPIEVIVIAFPGNRFNGEIIPELERLVENDTISIIDGVAIVKAADGEVEFVEFDQDHENEHAQRLAGLFNRLEALVSDDDIRSLAADLEPNSSAAILVFEHIWAKPFQDAIVDSGGFLAANFRVPATTVEELLAELAVLED
jgi:uncharacterized membrane protein